MGERELYLFELNARRQASDDKITHLSTGIASIRDGKVLVLRRARHDFRGGTFELPGGGIEENESFSAAVAREFSEETGLHILSIDRVMDGFDYSTDRKPAVRQINFVVTSCQAKPVVNLNEHDRYLWVDVTELASLHMSAEIRACIESILN